MVPPVAEQLLQHARSLRALARALVGDADADDLLQDAAVQALAAPPRRPGPLGGWLAAVLRHLASKHRRAARRRQRRECAAARGEAVPGADVEAAARDQFERLSAAVLELPSSYQGAVLRRYLQQQTPAEIAAATGVPLATVKSQLQRGLSLLRQRLARSGGDWRAGLAAAFALRLPATGVAAGATGTMATGVVHMAAAVKLAGVGAAAVLAIGAAWWMRAGESAAPVGAVAPATAAAVAAAAEAPRSDAERIVAEAPQRTLLAEPRPAPASIRGRCVDEQGVPLACRVSLQARAQGAGDFEFWVRHHYDPQWQDPAAIDTGSDGRFEFRFVPHAPLQFCLTMQGEGRVAMRARWPARTQGDGFEPGAAVDFGDVVLRRGMQVRGRVLDDRGDPVAGARVGIRARPQVEASPQPMAQDADEPRTGADGTFAAVPLPPGPYQVDCFADGCNSCLQPHDLLEPSPWLELRLVRLPPPERSIRGVVVDQSGGPLARASVHADGVARSGWSQDDGTFVLAAGPDSPAILPQVQVSCDGFDPASVPGPITWNGADLRVVLRRGVDLELQVVDAEGRPVEDFAAWAWPDHDAIRGSRLYLEADQRARTFGHHDGGRALLQSVRRGPHCLYVEPRADWLMATEVLRIDTGALQPAALRVQLPPVAARTVLVVDAGGAPVAGTQVELLEQVQGALRDDLAALPIEQMVGTFLQSGKALLRQVVTTDAAGAARLRGPAGGRFAVRCPGPRNLPAFAAAVGLDDPAPLILRVQRGGALQVELRPAGVVAALRGYAGLGEQPVPAWEPKLQLLRAAAAVGGDRDELREVPLRADDTATLAGLPPGPWQVRLSIGARSSALFVSRSLLPLGSCTLRDGETSRMQFDLPQLLPAELCATVLHNGAPLAKVGLRLCGVFDASAPDRDARRSTWSQQLTTDDAGAFTATVRPGRYTVVATDPFQVAADEVIALAAGDRAAVTFTLRSGSLRVRFTDAAGQVVPQVDAVLVDPESGEEAFALAGSGADGASITAVAARRFLLFGKRVHEDDRPDELLPLGEVLVREGLTTAVERALPASWLQR